MITLPHYCRNQNRCAVSGTALGALVNFDKHAMADCALPRRSKRLIAATVAPTTRCPERFDVPGQITGSPDGTEGEVLEGLQVDAAPRAGDAGVHFSPGLPSYEGSQEGTYASRIFEAVLEGRA